MQRVSIASGSDESGSSTLSRPVDPVLGAIQPEPMTVVDDPTQFFSADALQDPYPLYDRMRAEAPVHRIGDSVFYAICGWNAVLEAVERVEDF